MRGQGVHRKLRDETAEGRLSSQRGPPGSQERMSLPPHTHTKTLYSEEDTGQSPKEPQQSMGRKRESQRGRLRRVKARPNGLRPSGAAWQHPREPRPGFESSLYTLPAMLTWGLHSPICKTGLIYFLQQGK